MRRRGIEDEAVLRAMERVPRERFVPAAVRSHAYRDGALAIGSGQTISQPWIVARMTELLALAGPERVLEVGSGSGYGAAVLSRVCSHVVTVERHADLALAARTVLADLDYLNVEVREGDGALGLVDRAPFDAIVVAATAKHGPPQALLDQLVPEGALVCPVGRGKHERLVRVRDGAVEDVAAVRFVPLVEGEA
ncbi:MAG: protein-L-isoaspartate(D-aspartate) O-methyltransferase [Thermoleophilaceae bacterium]|nr:protein-L-isoaspartate(D-aspartate) O-methyltransferase [Thermoleophilaceae bacterium]